MFENVATSGGYLGIFILSFIASSLLPIFLEPIVAGLPAIGFNLFPTVMVISAGATLGSLTTYYLGLGSEVVAEKFNKGGIGARIHGWFAMHEWIGISVVFLGALTPFPFDVVTFIAGFSKFSVKLYIVGCFIGKLAKFVIIMMFGNALWSYFF
jgi:membrane protein YqaA with SNARE-associated domain